MNGKNASSNRLAVPKEEKRLTASAVFSRRDKMRIRTLYVIQGLSPKEIAEKTDFDDRQVRNLVHRQGWAEARREAEAKASKAMTQAADKAATEAGAFIESVAVQSQELAEDGFDRARDAPDSKEFALAMKGTQIAVQLARQALGIDGASASASAKGGAAAFVFMRFGDAQPTEKAAESVEVQATEIAADEITLDFEQSQKGEYAGLESAELISNRSQAVDIASAK